MGKNIVVSAINIVDGGALTVLQDAIKAFDSLEHNELSITFLVASKSVHSSIKTNLIKFKYFPLSKKSWAVRFFYEYFYFYLYSLKHKPSTWLSLHDTTPTVKATNRFVYCHNPSIFLDFPLKDIQLDFKQFLFSTFYKYLYKINIRKNTSVITQQVWIADAFKKIFNVKHILIAEPDIIAPYSIYTSNSLEPINDGNYKLFYPAYPRYFKNHAVIFEAQSLSKNIVFWLTIDGKENKYSRQLLRKHNPDNIEMLGLLDRSKVFELYAKCDALVFPSLLETWGLPLTEFKNFNKPVIAADLPYAHESLGDYNKIYWFSPNSAESLASAIDRARCGLPPDSPKSTSCSHKKILGWKALASHLLETSY